MTESDTQRIEKELGVTIPAELRSIWLNYPLKAEQGNSERYIWDDAEAIIGENRRLRDKRNWPSSLLFIGSDGAGNQFALDLNSPGAPVGIEFEDFERQFDPLEQWEVKRRTLSGWFTAVITEMVEDGYDLEHGEEKEGIWSSIFIIIAGILILFVIFFAIGAGSKLIDHLFKS